MGKNWGVLSRAGLLVTFINSMLFSRLIAEYRNAVNRRHINRENRVN